MLNKTYIYSYNNNSEGAREIANSLGIPRIRHEGSKFKGDLSKTVINWGSTELPKEVEKCKVINSVTAVNVCSDKLLFFKTVEGSCSIPLFTSDKDEAKKWLKGGGLVFARTTLRGHSGLGIVEVYEEDDMVNAPLYTRYISKKFEYRVHVVAGKVILVQRKGLRSGIDLSEVNWHIQNHQGGFIFLRNEQSHEMSPCVVGEALKAFNSIKGLTFGSVDVIYNKHSDKAYVLEINTASGLEGGTIEDYSKAFEEYLK